MLISSSFKILQELSGLVVLLPYPQPFWLVFALEIDHVRKIYLQHHLLYQSIDSVFFISKQGLLVLVKIIFLHCFLKQRLHLIFHSILLVLNYCWIIDHQQIFNFSQQHSFWTHFCSYFNLANCLDFYAWGLLDPYSLFSETVVVTVDVVEWDEVLEVRAAPFAFEFTQRTGLKKHQMALHYFRCNQFDFVLQIRDEAIFSLQNFLFHFSVIQI